jgi:hypothetical protein
LFVAVVLASPNANAAAPDQPTLVNPSNGATGVSLSPELRVNVTDPDADPLDVTFYGREDGTSPPAEDFTIIHLTDTQHYAQTYPTTFNAITQWIRDNQAARNIVFTTLSGDIVNVATDVNQWLVADGAMSTIEPPILPLYPDGIPFGVSPGNHDVGDGLVNYNVYFGLDRFCPSGSCRSYYGDSYSGLDNNNHYDLFSAGGMDFIAIHLNWGVEGNPGVLSWADNLLQTFSDRRAIIISHYLMESGAGGAFSPTGTAIFNAVMSNPNLFMMLAGHRHGEGLRADTGTGGNEIFTMVANYQQYPNGGDGNIRILEFSPINDEIRVFTYSVTSDTFLTDADSQFVLPYDMNAGPEFVPLGTINDVTSGGDAFVTWPGRSPGSFYEWYVEVSDGSSVTTGSTWTFGVACAVNGDCDDMNPCTDDSCNTGTATCEFSDNTAVCDDGDLCTTPDVCGGGTCGGTPVSCPTGQSCNANTGICRADQVTVDFQQGVAGYAGTVDTFLDSSAPVADNSAAAGLVVDLIPQRHVLLRFDNVFESQGGPIPDGATIQWATLTINVTNESANAGASLHRILQTWNDSDSWDTWIGGIQTDGTEAAATADVSSSSAVGPHVIDVTPSVTAWSAGTANHGWAWLPPATDNSWQFHSAEGGTPPVLSVGYLICITDSDCDDANACTIDTCSTGTCVYTDDDLAACDDNDLCTTADTCSAGTCVGTPVGCPPGEACSETTGTCLPIPGLVSFQEGVDGYSGTQDTYFQVAAPANVNGALDALNWDDDNPDGLPIQKVFALIRFDNIIGSGPGQIPQGAQIVSAFLEYTVFDIGQPGAVHEMLVDWDESDSLTSACGASCDEGSDYSSTNVDTAPASVAGMFEIDVAASLQSWADDPSGHRGWIVVPSSVPSPGGGVDVRSSEYAGLAERPRLTVEYLDCTQDAHCDDGNPCNGAETCSSGACTPGTPTDCGAQVCNPGTGTCVDCLVHADCDDSDVCNGAETCDVDNTCLSGTDLNCDDGVGCTDDSCDPGLGCESVNNCTGGLVCNPGSGVCETPECFVNEDCNDEEACTTDSCNGGICGYTPSGLCSIDGTVYYYRDNLAGVEPSAKGVPNVDIDLTTDSIADETSIGDGTWGSDVFGNIDVSTLDKFGTPRASDHNNAVTSFDASIIAQHAVTAIVLSANQQIAGDVTGNGSVSSFDAAMVARFAVLFEHHFAIANTTGSDWSFLRCDNYVGAESQDCTAPLYQHNPVGTTQTDDFYAILYGDVTGNWMPAGSRAVSAEQQAAEQDRREGERLRSEYPDLRRRLEAVQTSRAATLSVRAASGPLRAGERRTLTLEITAADGVEALDLALRYDAARVAIIDVQTVGLGDKLNLVTNDRDGVLRVALYGVLPLEGSGGLLSVTIEAREDLRGGAPVRIVGEANEGRIPLQIGGQVGARRLPKRVRALPGDRD